MNRALARLRAWEGDGIYVYLQRAVEKRADERTRTVLLLQLQVIILRCRGLHGSANPAYLSRFITSALHYVAPHCARGGIRAVSKGRGLRIAGSFANQMWQALESP